jgi:hypothetical protein
MLYAVVQQASSSEIQQWLLSMISAVEMLTVKSVGGVTCGLTYVGFSLAGGGGWVRQLPLSVLASKPSPT